MERTLRLLSALPIAVVLLLPVPAWSQLSEGELKELLLAVINGDKKALARVEKAAADGDIGAASRLGSVYILGQAVPRDIQKGVRLTRRAADAGDLFAQISLAKLYEEGKHVPRDYAEALKWYRQAASKVPRMNMEVARFYEKGLGVRPDVAEFIRWVRKAAEAGDVEGEITYGIILARGNQETGLKPDLEQALPWLKKAEAKGHPHAAAVIQQLYPSPDRQLMIQIGSGTGHMPSILSALAKGANVNAVDGSGTSVLAKACFFGQFDVVQELLKRGANVNSVNSYQQTALMSAANYGDPRIVRALIEKGADVNVAQKNGMTALSMAQARLAKAYVVKSERDRHGRLISASKGDLEEVVRILTDAGAKR